MAKTRLHKVVHHKDKGLNLFNHVKRDGKALGCPNVATDKVNEKWPDYEEVCVETFGLDITESPKLDKHELLVLRGNVRCCCGGACPYPEDHDLCQGGAYSKLARTHSIDQPKNLDHYPGQDYVECTMHYNDFDPIHNEAIQRLKAGTITGLVAEIKADTDPVGLTAEDIQSQLGVLNVEEGGLLSAPDAAATVLAGTNTNADDYLWVAAFAVMFKRLLGSSHARVAQDWPQRGKMRSYMFQPRA
jgi:hypothetical protein